MVKVELPAAVRRLAGLAAPEIALEVAAPVTLSGVLDAIEAAYPALRNTLCDPAIGARRAFIRFYANEEVLSHLAAGAELPLEVSAGAVPLLVIAAIAGGA